MPREPKTYGGCIHHNGKQVRAIVRTTTKKRAVELLNEHTNISMAHFNDYFCPTGNELELETTKDTIDIVFITHNDWSSDRKYTKL